LITNTPLPPAKKSIQDTPSKLIFML